MNFASFILKKKYCFQFIYFHDSWTKIFYATWIERAGKKKEISGILVENVVVLTLLRTSLGNFEFTPAEN